jgi:lipoprotein NlpI
MNLKLIGAAQESELSKLAMRPIFPCIAALLVLCVTPTLWGAAAPDANALLKQAAEAGQAGKTNEALALAIKATEVQPTNAAAWFFRGRIYETMRDHTNAIAAYDRAIKLDPKPVAFQQRGEEHFRIGNFEKSVADFDRFIELVPSQAAHHWQRGISLYYAGKYEEGRKQFESHQTVNPKDVENAVWHFLCLVRASGIEKARASLIPIDGDTRVPMKEIHSLFAGKGTAEEVLAAASTTKKDQPMFYAHLYLGLYYEALGEPVKAREHIVKAARDFSADHYMGDVARIHASVLEKRK